MIGIIYQARKTKVTQPSAINNTEKDLSEAINKIIESNSSGHDELMKNILLKMFPKQQQEINSSSDEFADKATELFNDTKDAEEKKRILSAIIDFICIQIQADSASKKTKNKSNTEEYPSTENINNLKKEFKQILENITFNYIDSNDKKTESHESHDKGEENTNQLIEDLQNQMTSYKQKEQNLSTQIENLNKDIKGKTNTISSLTNDNKHYITTINNLEKDNKKYKNNIETLDENQKNNENIIKNLQKDKKDNEVKIKSLGEEIKNLNTTIQAGANSQHQVMSIQINKLKKQRTIMAILLVLLALLLLFISYMFFTYNMKKIDKIEPQIEPQESQDNENEESQDNENE